MVVSRAAFSFATLFVSDAQRILYPIRDWQEKMSVLLQIFPQETSNLIRLP